MNNKINNGSSFLDIFKNRISGNCNEDEKEYMKSSLKDLPKELEFVIDTSKIIFYCGSSVHATGKIKYFKKNSLKT